MVGKGPWSTVRRDAATPFSSRTEADASSAGRCRATHAVTAMLAAAMNATTNFVRVGLETTRPGEGDMPALGGSSQLSDAGQGTVSLAGETAGADAGAGAAAVAGWRGVDDVALPEAMGVDVS